MPQSRIHTFQLKQDIKTARENRNYRSKGLQFGNSKGTSLTLSEYHPVTYADGSAHPYFDMIRKYGKDFVKWVLEANHPDNLNIFQVRVLQLAARQGVNEPPSTMKSLLKNFKPLLSKNFTGKMDEEFAQLNEKEKQEWYLNLCDQFAEVKELEATGVDLEAAIAAVIQSNNLERYCAPHYYVFRDTPNSRCLVLPDDAVNPLGNNPLGNIPPPAAAAPPAAAPSANNAAPAMVQPLDIPPPAAAPAAPTGADASTVLLETLTKRFLEDSKDHKETQKVQKETNRAQKETNRAQKETNEVQKETNEVQKKVNVNVQNQLDAQDIRMDGQDRRMDGQDRRMDGQDRRMDGFESKTGEIEGNLDDTNHEIIGLHAKVTTLTKQYDTLKKKLAIQDRENPAPRNMFGAVAQPTIMGEDDDEDFSGFYDSVQVQVSDSEDSDGQESTISIADQGRRQSIHQSLTTTPKKRRSSQLLCHSEDRGRRHSRLHQSLTTTPKKRRLTQFEWYSADRGRRQSIHPLLTAALDKSASSSQTTTRQSIAPADTRQSMAPAGRSS